MAARERTWERRPPKRSRGLRLLEDAPIETLPGWARLALAPGPVEQIEGLHLAASKDLAGPAALFVLFGVPTSVAGLVTAAGGLLGSIAPLDALIWGGMALLLGGLSLNYLAQRVRYRRLGEAGQYGLRLLPEGLIAHLEKGRVTAIPARYIRRIRWHTELGSLTIHYRTRKDEHRVASIPLVDLALPNAAIVERLDAWLDGTAEEEEAEAEAETPTPSAAESPTERALGDARARLAALARALAGAGYRASGAVETNDSGSAAKVSVTETLDVRLRVVDDPPRVTVVFESPREGVVSGLADWFRRRRLARSLEDALTGDDRGHSVEVTRARVRITEVHEGIPSEEQLIREVKAVEAVIAGVGRAGEDSASR